MRPAQRLVAMAVATVAVASSAGCSARGDDSDPAPAPPAPTASPSTTPTTTVRLGDALDWHSQREVSCLVYDPPGDTDVILRVDEALDLDCIAQASPNATTIIFAPYEPSELLGDPAPWETIDGAEVRRISDGLLAEMSSRYVDGLTCAACDQVIVVMGPEPTKVRRLVESVEAGSQFRPDPWVHLGCTNQMTGSDLGWVHQDGATPREAAETLLKTKAPDAEVITWPDDEPYAVLVPHDSQGDRTMIVVVRNEAGLWDADQIYRCSD